MSEILILIAIIGSFVAGFIDAVVGGGGLVQVPLLFILFPNLSHTNIIGTNRLASFAGTIVAAVSYLKKIAINRKAILVAGAFAAIASIGGTFVMQKIDTNIFKPVLLVIIILLALYTFFKKEIGQQEKIKYANADFIKLFAAIGLVVGFYNGVIGPGTGTLLVFALVQFVGLNFLKASAYAKAINAVADGASLVAFVIQGAIIYKIALPMMATNMLGAFIGSKMAIQQGNKFIRIFFIVVLVLLIARFGWDIFNKYQ
jgi:uncharacterized protein